MYGFRIKNRNLFGFLFIAACHFGCAELDLGVDTSPLSESDQTSSDDSDSSIEGHRSEESSWESDTPSESSDSKSSSASEEADAAVSDETDSQIERNTDDTDSYSDSAMAMTDKPETDEPVESDEEPQTDSVGGPATDTMVPEDTENDGGDTEDTEIVSETDTDVGTVETDELPSDIETEEMDTIPVDSDTHTENSATDTEDTDIIEIDTVDTDTSSITSGTLMHRWGFNGTLADSVGGSDATIMTPIGAVGGSASVSDSEVVMSGGSYSVAQWVSLGSGLITNIGGPVTIELFTTLGSVNYFSRIFEFGGGRYEYLLMTWTYGNDGNQDLVRWWDTEQVSVTGTNAPYAVGQEYHIVITIESGGGTKDATRIVWYSALSTSSEIGPQRGALETTDQLSNLNDADLWLGKSHSNADPVTHGSYNEVRIWSGALSASDISLLHQLGPDM